MDPQPDDLTAIDDLTLLQSARAGDRLAFGVLYLRHHAAAWRMACVACRFSPDAELAVIEGFTRVFSALPEESEEFAAGGVTFRPYLLACVRQAALDRARAAGRAGGDDEPAPLAGLAPDGEVVLSSLEHHVARGALAAIPERARTALWLADVEAMTQGEIAGILGGSPRELADLTAAAREDVQAGKAAALGGHEVRADCRFTAEHLEDYESGKLDPAEGVLVRSHLDGCPPCRMRLDELTNAPAALAAAVPAAPLLGGETQHHWLTSAATVHPAHRLLPPGIAAAAPARRRPDVLRRPG
ncbi:MAG: zf-HC2 domain-containing protein, partial [Actinobacteria bacterium]|nr:zf-HC2 domain-containing protein [Actinomycetota bacterium]